MAANDRFLGGVAPRATARTLAKFTSLRALVLKEDRAFLAQTERIKLQNNAEKGLETKYDLLDNVNLTDVETLKAVCSMSIRTEELREEMARYDMHEIMVIPGSFTYDNADGYHHPAQGASPINLFNSAEASTWIMMFGQDYHSENSF